MEVAARLRGRPELVLSTNLPLRRSPRFVRLRELIAGGELGELFHLEGDYDYGRRHKLTDGWRGRIPYYSVMLGGGIHMIDLLTWVSGLNVTEVVAADGQPRSRPPARRSSIETSSRRCCAPTPGR